jgi:hypothetical protein
VLIAHLLLTHLGGVAQGAQATNKNKLLDLPSVPQSQLLLRQKLWDDTINCMQKGARYRSFGKKLKQVILLET